MTVRDWLKDYEWWPQVELNANLQKAGGILETEDESAAEALQGAFIWGITPEGHDFWSNIYENLQQ